MSYEQPSVERTAHMRVRARGTVTLRCGGREIHGRGVVVGDTCLAVRCRLGFRLLSMAGQPVEITMRLDGGDTRFVAHGRIARVRAADHTLVIALDALPEPLAMLMDADTGNPVITPLEVMIVDTDRARRTQVSTAFRAEGCRVVEVGTPLEAVHALTRARIATDMIAVADTTPASVGAQLRNYLDTAHEGAMIVGIGRLQWMPMRRRLDPSDAGGMLRSNVKALLRLRPWRSVADRSTRAIGAVEL